jgi:hypothetical protein
LVYFLVFLFQNAYTILFWEFYFLPFSVHVQTNVIYVALLSFHFKTCSVRVHCILISNEEYCHVSGIQWPVHSSHQTVPTSFLWGYLKEYVYRNHPQVLKHPIRDKIVTINQRAGSPSFWQSFESHKIMSCKLTGPTSRFYLSTVINTYQTICFVHKTGEFHFKPHSCVKSSVGSVPPCTNRKY